MTTRWIGVDLDGTLAKHEPDADVDHVGEPVPAMVARVKKWLALGIEVRIVTARMGPTQTLLAQRTQMKMIQAWCLKHVGQKLPVTASKDFGMVRLWDDRAVQVVRNAGVGIDDLTALGLRLLAEPLLAALRAQGAVFALPEGPTGDALRAALNWAEASAPQ